MELFKVVEQMNTLRSECSYLRNLIGDQLKYNYVEDAEKSFEILRSLRKAISELENTEIHISPVLLDMVEKQKKYNAELISKLRSLS